MIYNDLKIKEITDKMEKIEITDIANKLIASGHQVETKKGIDTFSLDKDSMLIATKGTGTIQINYEENENIEHYAVIRGQYYKMTLENSKVTINKTATTIRDGVSIGKLEVEFNSETNLKVEEINENSIILKAGSTAETVVATIKYGDTSKECEVSVKMKPLIETPDSTVELNTDYGLVDVIWLSQDTNEYSAIPNEPDLYNNLAEADRLTPVTWTYYQNGTTVNGKIVNWVEDLEAKQQWYEYSSEKGNDGKEDNITSEWANAKNSDGSYFVWIPRYAYRITYYSDESYTNVTGYYDGEGMWEDEEGKKKYDLDAGIETVEHNGKKYIVHPAFTDDRNKTDSSGNALEDYARGGWDKDLTGIWVAKYEMSTEDNDGVITYLSVPNVQSVGKTAIGNMYNISKSYDIDKKSHMIKNSEWGAVALLTHSQYGRNGHEIDINTSSNFITGSGNIEEIADSETTGEYNTIYGAKASTTGNVYGIYDMSGGKWEHVAAYNRFGKRLTYQNDANKGKIILSDVTDASGEYISTKYITAYENDFVNGAQDGTSSARLFMVGKVGDATKEVRATSQDAYWFSDNPAYIIPNAPYFGRGGASEGVYSGIFYSDSTHGQPLAGVSFRLVLGK